MPSIYSKKGCVDESRNTHASSQLYYTKCIYSSAPCGVNGVHYLQQWLLNGAKRD